MSDGTLRAVGVLGALFGARSSGTSLVGIEEPENALHPAATGVLLDAVREASTWTQVLITSHGSDLLDREDLDPGALLSVRNDHGATVIGPVGDVERGVLSDSLFTAGEMLRMDQLDPRAEAADTSRTASDIDFSDSPVPE